MKGRWPWTSGARLDDALKSLERAERRFDRLSEAHERLVEKMVTMRRRFDPVPPTRAVRPPEDVDTRARERAEGIAAENLAQGIRANGAAFLENAVRDLMARGVDRVTAEREAKALLAAATDFHPAGE